MAALKCFYRHFCQTLAFQNTSANCFAGISNGVIVPYLNSVVPIKSRFVHGKRYSSLHKSLAMLAVSKTISLFNQKPPPNDFEILLVSNYLPLN